MSRATIRTAISHGKIRVGDNDQIDVHQADAHWGARYVWRVLARCDYASMTDFERSIWSTIGWQWHGRRLVRAGELPDNGVIERQLAAQVLSKHCWEMRRDESGQALQWETLERAA